MNSLEMLLTTNFNYNCKCDLIVIAFYKRITIKSIFCTCHPYKNSLEIKSNHKKH